MVVSPININQGTTAQWTPKHAQLADIIKSNNQGNFNKAEALVKDIDPNVSHQYGGVSWLL